MPLSSLKRSSALVYEPLPAGLSDTAGPITGRRRSLQARPSTRRYVVYAAVITTAAFLVILVAVVHRSPSDLLSIVSSHAGESGLATAALDADGLPRLDWSWKRSGWFRPAPVIGSTAWLKRYPDFIHGPPSRQSWLDRYHAVQQRGLIPAIPKGELVGGLANYPAGVKLDDTICSYRRADCISNDDIYKAPAAHWAINFDDGPLPPSAALYEKLDEWNEHATHFWVGSNVKDNWQLAVQAAQRGDHLAVHTWSHPHLTTYTDEQIVGELGWTMQIIYDISEHVPLYYRPPFGDVDNRVRAIAKHVFNMTAVIWNYDSFDWSLNQTWSRGDFIDPPMDWLTTHHSTERLTQRMQDNDHINGEGVVALEHELSFESIQAFTDSYPMLRKLKWRTGALPDLLNIQWYQNL